MPIRLSGMVSGMDTDTLVAALVSQYSVKKDNLVKAQTKLSWKQEKWKDMNKKIYSFYSGRLSAARMSSTYNLKTASISNSTYAKVSASAGAVNGTQSLRITELARTGYLTGGEVQGVDENGNKSKLTGGSKLSQITNNGTGFDGGSIRVTVDGKSKDITLTGDMTINQFVGKLKDAGLNANFDADTQRFFVSSKTSGKEHDFSMVANNDKAFNSLKAMGLYTNDATTSAEYEKWAEYCEGRNDDGTYKYTDGLNAVIEQAYESSKISYDSVAAEKVDLYNRAASIVDAFETKYQADAMTAKDNADNQLKSKKEFVTNFEADHQIDGEFDATKLSADDLKTYNEAKKSVATIEGDIKNYEDALTAKTANAEYVVVNGDGSVTAKTDNEDIKQEVKERNDKLKEDLTNQYQAKVRISYDILHPTSTPSKLSAAESAGAVRITGEDATIELNGAEFTSNTNNFSINGLTIQATAVTGPEAVTITTETDIDGIYDTIKGFFKDYNELIKSMEEAYNATSSKGYEPLTDEEKEAMSDDEVEKWETKIKDSLLRKDQTLDGLVNMMKNDMMSSFKIGDKSYSLASFGISTMGYFAAGENEKGVFHIAGDKDDTSSFDGEDKLKAAIAKDPDTVISFFSQLSSKLYSDLGKKMSTSAMSSAFTVYNDKEMGIQYSQYNSRISDEEDKVKRWEDYYYKKFSAMESALAQLNSQSASLSNLFGGL